MLTGTIIRLPNGTYRVRISKHGPQTDGDVKIVEVLQQKDNETEEKFKERCIRFVQEECP